jgi:hypothetical protein
MKTTSTLMQQQLVTLLLLLACPPGLLLLLVAVEQMGSLLGCLLVTGDRLRRSATRSCAGGVACVTCPGGGAASGNVRRPA